jgi:thiamine kinase-like enzyme
VGIYKRGISSLLKNGIRVTFKKMMIVKRRQRFLKYYYNKNKLFKAIRMGEKIVKADPKNLYNYQQLARAYWKNKDLESAQNTLRKGIKHNYNIVMEEIIREIERIISKKSSLKPSTFIFNGGHQNYGLIEHTFEDINLVTKILPHKEARGEIFLREVQQKYKTLKKITPEIKNILTIKDLCFITMVRVEGDEPKLIDTNIMEKVFEINHSIISVDYSDLSKLLNEKPLKTNHVPANKHELFKSFYLINQKDKKVITGFTQFLTNMHYPKKCVKIVEDLNKLIISNNCIESIIPERHFRLQHGDFFKDNMLLNNQSGELKVIDWGGIRVGPRWVDLALFLAISKLHFNNIRQNFLEQDKCIFEPVEKLFFIYTLIVSWVAIHKDEIELCYQNFCTPALEYFEILLAETGKYESVKTTG